MIITIDIGNTCSNIAVFDGDKIVSFFRISTDQIRTEDQYAAEMSSIFKYKKIDVSKVDCAVISSVVPIMTVAIKKAIKMICDCKIIVVGPGIKTNLNIKIDNPSQLGADMVAAAVASSVKYPFPQIIFDMGTATSISVLNANGDFVGCSITAGVEISLDALVSRTSLLQKVNLENTGNVIGTNTNDCIKSGIVYGTASMMDGMIERMEEELGEKATVIATGGHSNKIVPHCKKKIIYDEFLLMEGLKIIYDKNNTFQKG